MPICCSVRRKWWSKFQVTAVTSRGKLSDFVFVSVTQNLSSKYTCTQFWCVYAFFLLTLTYGTYLLLKCEISTVNSTTLQYHCRKKYCNVMRCIYCFAHNSMSDSINIFMNLLTTVHEICIQCMTPHVLSETHANVYIIIRWQYDSHSWENPFHSCDITILSSFNKVLSSNFKHSLAQTSHSGNIH